MRKLKYHSTFPFHAYYYIKRPWKWFHDLKWGIINKYNRMKCGFSYVDLWNFDQYLGDMVPNALDELAERSCGWPGVERGYHDFEDWANELHLLAKLIRLATADMLLEKEEREFIRGFRVWESGEMLEPIKNLRWYTQYKITDYHRQQIAKAENKYQRLDAMKEALSDVIWPNFARVFPSLWD